MDSYHAEWQSKLIKLDNWRNLYGHSGYLPYKNSDAQGWFEKITGNRLNPISFYRNYLQLPK